MRPSSVSLARRSLICAALFGAAAAAGPAHAWGSGERVTGSGKIVTESRALSGYTAIHLKASFKVVVRESGREGVELRGDDNLLPLIETQVVDSGDGRALELRWRDGVSISHRDSVVVTVDVADLRAISVAGSGSVVSDGLKTTSLGLAVAGSGDIKVTQLQAGDCGVKLSGSGDVLLSGRASSLAVSVAGSGDVDAQALEAAQVAVKIAGSGDVSVNASQSLAVSIAGSGDVKHRGAAQPQVSVSGSGRVRRV